MRIVSNIAAMQRLAGKWRRAGMRIGFVPTMGYLHAGPFEPRQTRAQAVGKNGKVVVSIYVNPTQFAPTEDFSKYPRDLKRDLKLCRDAGVDVVFTPSDAEMYPAGSSRRGDRTAQRAVPAKFSTYVVEEKLSPSDGRRVAADAFSRRDDGRRQVVQPRAAGRGRVWRRKIFSRRPSSNAWWPI